MIYRSIVLIAVVPCVMLGFWLSMPDISMALTPGEILVIANKNAADSVGLAKYYMQKRSIPEENLLQIWVTDEESCSREQYNKRIAAPVRRFLNEEKSESEIRCLLLMYGVPLKVSGPPLSAEEKTIMDELKSQQAIMSEKLIHAEDSEKAELKKSSKTSGRKSEEKRTNLTVRVPWIPNWP